jgi:hypothetical protein
MPRISIATAGITVCAGLLLAPPAPAEPPRAALVVGNATYTAMPGIVGCARSANAVSAALRALNFDVTERQDASTGGIDAGIAEFSQHLADGKGAAFVYVCGYGTDFNDRTFVLPTTARIGRPSDVMTQGVLAKSMLSTVTRDPATVAVVVFDLIPQPDGPPRIALDALTGSAVPDGVGVIAAAETTPGDGLTPLATALVAALAGPQVHTEGLLSSVQAKLAGSKLSLAALHSPVRPGFLAGAPPAVEPRAPPPAASVAAPAAPPVAAAPPAQIPDEAQMTEFDRRKVQDALVRLGYYDRAVDAVFGPETRAAIRRYQHEIGSELTGHLTADQASRLVNSH